MCGDHLLGQAEHQRHRLFRDVLLLRPRRTDVRDLDASLAGCTEVDVVVAVTGALDDFEVLGRHDVLARDRSKAGDDHVGPCECRGVFVCGLDHAHVREVFECLGDAVADLASADVRRNEDEEFFA
jgi:hypothetical protein